MKSINWKKFGIFTLIIIGIIALIFLIVKGFTSNNKVTEEEKEGISDIAINNVVNLTQGYDTVYDGIDVLFASDKTTVESLPDAIILNSAIRYIHLKEMDTSIENGLLENIKLNEGYDPNKYTFYKAETIKTAIKELFDIDWKHTSATYEINFTRKFIYLPGYEVYVVDNIEKSSKSNDFNIDTKEIETIKEKDIIKTTIAIAYIYNDGTEYKYMKDSSGKEVIYSTQDSINENEIKDEYIDQFDKFEITLKEVDGRYVFVSIEKK